MKKILLLLIFLFCFLPILTSVKAQIVATPTPPYDPCLGAWCPLITGTTYTCAAGYEDWLKNKSQNLWVSDPEVTALGKAGERSRQFLYWALTHRSIDNHPVILSVWSFARNIVYFFLLLIVAIFGLGIIIGQRANFSLKIEVWPLILKTGLLLLYVTFSATVVLLVIQLSDTMMLFFIERLGVRNLFNIFFLSAQGGSVILDSETAYKTFKGCSNISVELFDSVKTSKFLVNFTNMTYYLVGIMFILRKVILWLLLFVSPFLALLMPFVFIRNVGWIWIGVFFQWVFYGPLFGLFLGGLAAIWGSASHIPYNFDFSRANKMDGFIYPTSINILYGGPAQKLELLNSSNYTDTFAEYIIALVMLWAVTIFPWWLLRIFRDYCCDGIYATKNILLSMYDQMRGGPTPFGPGPITAPAPSDLSTGTARQIPTNRELPTVTKLETTEEIRKTKTEDISRSLQFSASKLTDIALFETNKQKNETVNKNINFLQNPMKAETPTERQKYMNIRSELFSRAVKEDKTAKQVLSSLSTSKVEQLQKREQFISSIPQSVPVSHLISVKVKIPQEKVQSIANNFFKSVSENNEFITNVAKNTNVQTSQIKTVLNSVAQNLNQSSTNLTNKISQQTGVAKNQVKTVLTAVNQSFSQAPSFISNHISNQTGVEKKEVNNILNSFAKNVNQPATNITNVISQETGIQKEKVTHVVESYRQTIKNNKELVQKIAKQENIKEEQVQKIITDHLPAMTQPEKQIEAAISLPPSVSLDEYEEVKKMWKNQYERGEVPVSDTIKSRDEWVEQDSIFITNVLNKLVSESPEIKQQGLDEIGYILPIFLINNLKGDQLMVYLKAKLEAAKEVQGLEKKEKEVKEEVQENKEEELVDVEKPKSEEQEKTMEMKEELPDKPNDKN